MIKSINNKSSLYRVLVLLIGLSIVLFSTNIWAQKNQIPSKNLFIENPEWSDKKAPEKDRNLRMNAAEKAVIKKMTALDKEIQNLCAEKQTVFRVKNEKSKLSVMSFKDFAIPVPGRFTHFDGYITWQEGVRPPKANLIIDTGSWNSDNLWRDSRVKRYLLKANKTKYASALLDLRYYGPKKQSSGNKNIVGSLNFRGKNYEILAKSDVWKDGDNWVVVSREPLQLVTDIPNKSWLKIMERCVHKSLSKAVDLEWKLIFEPACKPN